MGDDGSDPNGGAPADGDGGSGAGGGGGSGDSFNAEQLETIRRVVREALAGLDAGDEGGGADGGEGASGGDEGGGRGGRLIDQELHFEQLVRRELERVKDSEKVGTLEEQVRKIVERPPKRYRKITQTMWGRGGDDD